MKSTKSQMNMRTTTANQRPPTGITVKVKSFANIEATALAKLQQTKPDAIKCEARPNWGIVEHHGKVAVLCSEGVGEDLTYNSAWGLDLYGSYKTPDGESFDCMPVFSKSMTCSDLIALPTEKELPLEDFIRRFGRRLESNFKEWHKALKS